MRRHAPTTCAPPPSASRESSAIAAVAAAVAVGAPPNTPPTGTGGRAKDVGGVGSGVTIGDEFGDGTTTASGRLGAPPLGRPPDGVAGVVGFDGCRDSDDGAGPGSVVIGFEGGGTMRLLSSLCWRRDSRRSMICELDGPTSTSGDQPHTSAKEMERSEARGAVGPGTDNCT